MKIVSCYVMSSVEKAMPNSNPMNLTRSPVSTRIAVQLMVGTGPRGFYSADHK